jgi:hypothetical protein
MRYPVVITLLVILLVVVGCGRVQNEQLVGSDSALPNGVEMTVTVTDAEALTVATASEAVIRLTQNGEPVSGATLAIEGNMTHAGMEPLFVNVTETAPGDYRAPLEWNMGGEWLLTVRGTLPDGTAIEQRVDGLNVTTQ